jgi:hypothetical protein
MTSGSRGGTSMQSQSRGWSSRARITVCFSRIRSKLSIEAPCAESMLWLEARRALELNTMLGRQRE